ncbi:MAG: sigma-70 family RNA polymerase sigma factor [Planctomycetes bacterium]|nr:sigma-70 family RNA polymerase sigma factor [Planctomycetota bacterium]
MNTPGSLLERLRRPADPEAWTRFVQLYTPLLFQWARRVSTQDEDAADLVQDVFTVLVEKLPEFGYDRHKSFRGWLHTVTLNCWRNTCRRRGVPLEGPDALAEVTSPDNVAAFAEAEYRHHLVGRALDLIRTDFQPATWQAFWEYAVCGRPAAEVAAALGLNVGAVRAAKFRVLCRLRQELAGLLD